MPDITLNIPSNSKFHSSLNEIDLAMGAVLLNQMRIADPRNKLGLQDVLATEEKNDWLWDYSRVFQVDELTTEEIFNTYLLRKNINKEKGVDVSYPILAFMQNDLETVFWGTGNRYKQWYFDLPSPPESWEVGDTVFIASMDRYRGLQGEIVEIKTEESKVFCKLAINGVVVTKSLPNLKKEDVWFNTEDLRATGDKLPSRYKAKSITGTYSAVILCDNRDEIQYIRDKFILRCADAQIWHKYASPSIGNNENQLFTVFEIPNIDRYSSSTDKLKGQGYIYGSAFKINYWGCLTDTPLPQSLIETIRMNIHVEGDGRTNRIVIS